MKNFLKKITPAPILNKYYNWQYRRDILKKIKAFKNEHYKFFENDLKRIIKYSNGYKANDTQEKILAQIIAIYHTIEKGLTMGEMRPGFGVDNLNKLIKLCKLHISTYGCKNEILIEAIRVIAEYNYEHKQVDYKLDEELQDKIDGLLSETNIKHPAKQLEYTKESFFKNTEAPFDTFSHSRHSLRDFNEILEIDIKTIEKAVALAQNAPSTCNMQSVRTHVLSDKSQIKDVLLLQNGNRGFGDRADKLIIVTTDLQCWGGPKQRFAPYLDSGFYAMNLLYSLHYYKVGACALNWYVETDNDIKLRELVEIPQNEVVSLIIACGGLKKQFKIAKSKRKHYKDITTIH